MMFQGIETDTKTASIGNGSIVEPVDDRRAVIRCRQNKGDLALDPGLHTQLPSGAHPIILGAAVPVKSRNAGDSILYLVRCNQSGAFELPGGVLMARAP